MLFRLRAHKWIRVQTATGWKKSENSWGLELSDVCLNAWLSVCRSDSIPVSKPHLSGSVPSVWTFYLVWKSWAPLGQLFSCRIFFFCMFFLQPTQNVCFQLFQKNCITGPHAWLNIHYVKLSTFLGVYKSTLVYAGGLPVTKKEAC